MQLQKLFKSINTRIFSSAAAVRGEAGKAKSTAVSSSSPSTSTPPSINIITPLTKPEDLPQSPNMAGTWSASQAPKHLAVVGPRFEQTDWSLQPNPLSAQELIAKVPVTMVPGRKAFCEGGANASGPLGHPKVYLNLDSNKPVACGYCGLTYQQDPHHHGHGGH